VNDGEYNEWFLSLDKLAIGSSGWNEVVKTARWLQNFMKEIYG